MGKRAGGPFRRGPTSFNGSPSKSSAFITGWELFPTSYHQSSGQSLMVVDINEASYSTYRHQDPSRSRRIILQREKVHRIQSVRRSLDCVCQPLKRFGNRQLATRGDQQSSEENKSCVSKSQKRSAKLLNMSRRTVWKIITTLAK